MSYYKKSDLNLFPEKVAEHRSDLTAKFMDYYDAALNGPGKLSKREKKLIALAVAHIRQCPYCIDAHTQGLLQEGSDLEEMTEAIHVAASLDAGITLVHGIQMHEAAKSHKK